MLNVAVFVVGADTKAQGSEIFSWLRNGRMT